MFPTLLAAPVAIAKAACSWYLLHIVPFISGDDIMVAMAPPSEVMSASPMHGLWSWKLPLSQDTSISKKCLSVLVRLSTSSTLNLGVFHAVPEPWPMYEKTPKPAFIFSALSSPEVSVLSH